MSHTRLTLTQLANCLVRAFLLSDNITYLIPSTNGVRLLVAQVHSSLVKGKRIVRSVLTAWLQTSSKSFYLTKKWSFYGSQKWSFYGSHIFLVGIVPT